MTVFSNGTMDFRGKTRRTSYCLVSVLLLHFAFFICTGQEIDIPLGYPSVLQSKTPSGDFEVTQRLIPLPFIPPDVELMQKEALSRENNWFKMRDKRKIDELGLMNFYAKSGRTSVAVVPKLHNSSAGIEIYRIPESTSKEAFQKRQGPYRSGVTSEFSNKRSATKLAKFKFGRKAESGMAYFYVSRILGKLVDVPPATYRTMQIEAFNRVSKQAHQTGNKHCTYAWQALRSRVRNKDSRFVLPEGKFVYGSLAENPRGEYSSPPSYWTIDRIKRKRFYKVISSSSPVSKILDLDDKKCLQDLALAQDLVRGVVLDEIFKQADRLGNISTEKLQHYVTFEGIVKWNDNLSEEDKAESITRFVELDRIVYKDNDDGMMWERSSIPMSPILDRTRHLDPVLYSRLQWLAGLMQDSSGEPASTVKEYFLKIVHISPKNYDELRKSVIKIAEKLKKRVDAKEIKLDLNFEITLKEILLKEANSAASPKPGLRAQPLPGN